MIQKEAFIFLIVGLIAVAVDYLVYQLIISFGIEFDYAKALSFMAGAAFSYSANKYWTFGHINHSVKSLPIFVLLYMFTLGTNVLVNQAVLYFSGVTARAVNASFILATLVSAILNFIGMKFLVFKEGRLCD